MRRKTHRSSQHIPKASPEGEDPIKSSSLRRRFDWSEGKTTGQLERMKNELVEKVETTENIPPTSLIMPAQRLEKPPEKTPKAAKEHER